MSVEEEIIEEETTEEPLFILEEETEEEKPEEKVGFNALLGAIGFMEVNYWPAWLLILFGLYPLIQSYKNRKNSHGHRWFVWFIVHPLLAIWFYLISYGLVPLWVFALIVLVNFLFNNLILKKVSVN